ncbi:MAG: hypothetical protein AAGA86_01770 [Bacteroidota bacterium]
MVLNKGNRNLAVVLLFWPVGWSCNQTVKPTAPVSHQWVGMEVTATAYNSLPYQTTGKADIAAWGDTLIPGEKTIAVSRDLLQLGLNRNTMVRIEGFADTFYVKDKMHSKWQRRIDIYMGEDAQKAKNWGRKKLCVEYAVSVGDFNIKSKE